MSGKMHIYNAAAVLYCLPAIRLDKEQILFHAGYLPHNIVAETDIIQHMVKTRKSG